MTNPNFMIKRNGKEVARVNARDRSHALFCHLWDSLGRRPTYSESSDYLRDHEAVRIAFGGQL